MSRAGAQIHIVDAGGTHERVTVEVMRRRGYFERLGVAARKTYVNNGGEAARLLLAGAADVAMQIGFGPALAAMAAGAPLRLIAAANLLTVHAVYSMEAQIRRLEDLPGRTMGVGALGALTHQLICAALRKRGIDPAAVRFVPIGSSATIFRALLAGQVDAGFGETEVFEHQQEYGVHALEGGVLWQELPEFPNQASFATLSALNQRRDVLVRTLAAHALLYRFLQQPDSWDEYAAAWSTALPEAPLAEGRIQWQFYQHHRPFAEDLRLPAVQVDYLQELNVSMRLQDRVVPAATIADDSLAREAVQLLEGMQP